MAEPTKNDYRIMSFEGKPDPSFVAGVARTCPGLPALGRPHSPPLVEALKLGFPAPNH